jgi:hypothetical protein
MKLIFFAINLNIYILNKCTLLVGAASALSWSLRATVRVSVTGSMGHARCKKMKRLPRGADELRRGPQTGKSRAINIMAISSVDDSLQVSRNRNAVVTCCGSFCFQESGHNCGTAGSRHAGLLDWGGASPGHN